MFRAVLIFPDNISLARYLLNEKPSKVETNSIDQSLSGTFTEEQIKRAKKEYRASIKTSRLIAK